MSAPRGRSGSKDRARLFGLLLIVTIICTTQPLAGAPAQTLDRIAADKAIRIGVVGDQAPFSSMTGPGGPVGYAVDLCNVVAGSIRARLQDVEIRYIETGLSAGFEAVAAGQMELLCGAITATLARRETVEFSEPIFVTGVGVLLRSDASRNLRELAFGNRTVSPPRSPELTPFAQTHIGVRSGTTAETALRRAVAKEGYQAVILNFDTHAQGIAALEAHQIDAYFADRALLIGLLAQGHDSSGLVMGTRLFTREPYAIGLPRNDSDFRLLVDRALTEFYAKRQFVELLAQHFGAEVAAIAGQVRALAGAE